MALTLTTIAFLCIGLCISVLIVAVSSMAIYETNHIPSESYRESVRWVGGISMGAALIALIASPIIIRKQGFGGLKKKFIAFLILSVLLSILVIAVSGMAIRQANVETSDSYNDSVQWVAGSSLFLALVGIISVFVVAYKLR